MGQEWPVSRLARTSFCVYENRIFRLSPTRTSTNSQGNLRQSFSRKSSARIYGCSDHSLWEAVPLTLDSARKLLIRKPVFELLSSTWPVASKLAGERPRRVQDFLRRFTGQHFSTEAEWNEFFAQEPRPNPWRISREGAQNLVSLIRQHGGDPEP